MVAVATRKKPKQAAAVSAPLPAPVGGWNAYDGLAEMPPEDAVTLTNWVPSATQVALRYGYTNYATGIVGQVETLLVYNGLTANKMFAFAGTQAYDVSSTGAVGAASLTGLTNARWQYINMATTGGNYAMAVNGADKMAFYTGSAWARDGDGAPYDISGVNTQNIIQINLHLNRVWLVQANTLDAWYLPTNAIGGTATKFSLNSVAKLGGTLRAMATWTIDAGWGLNDHAVFITSNGEVIVYNGTDPSSSGTWVLVGVYQLGSPVGRRCFYKYMGDLLIISQDGVQPLSAALQSSRTNPRVAITNKIQKSMSDAVSLYGSNFGWELILFPKQNQLYLNVPVQQGQSQQQYVMNTITKAWCNFTGWNANCWALYNDFLYFGGNTVVGQAWNGLTDNGSAISGFALQAFNFFKSAGQQKQFTMFRPILFTNGQPSIYGTVNVNFNTNDLTSSLATLPTNYALWDSALWDQGIWGSDLVVQDAWQGANAIGYCGAPALKVSASGIQVQWVSSILVYKMGGAI